MGLHLRPRFFMRSGRRRSSIHPLKFPNHATHIFHLRRVAPCRADSAGIVVRLTELQRTGPYVGLHRGENSIGSSGATTASRSGWPTGSRSFIRFSQTVASDRPVAHAGQGISGRGVFLRDATQLPSAQKTRSDVAAVPRPQVSAPMPAGLIEVLEEKREEQRIEVPIFGLWLLWNA